MFNAHINVGVFVDIRSVKYIFKYVYKGHDFVAVVIIGSTNEIQQYIDVGYLSAGRGRFLTFI
jgi:phosphoenolpyruvate-protein kinase (PTS system EI component)